MSYPDLADKRRICAVCGHTLDYYGWDDDSSPGLGWDHTAYDKDLGDSDHPAIPVLPGEVEDLARCDFCLVGVPGFIVPARTFQIGPGHMSEGDWAACPECAMLIREDKWPQLVDRVWTLSPHRDQFPEAVLRIGFRRMYGDLRKNITGTPYPIKK